MKHVGDLIIKAWDTRDFSGITEVTGDVLSYSGSIDLPVCTSVGGDVWAHSCSISLPACTSVGGYVRADNGSISLPVCTSVGGYVWADGGSKIDLPVCTSVGGGVRAYGGSKLDLPACTNIKGESFQIGALRMVEAGPWTAILTPGYLSIGCQRRTWDEWLAMSDEEIASLDDMAAEVSVKFRAAILAAKGE